MKEYGSDLNDNPDVTSVAIGHRTSKRPMERRRGTRSVIRSYFLAFEGMTECRYFEMIKDHKSELGIRSDIDIVNLSRYDQDMGNSDNRWMLDAMKEYMHLVKTGEYSVYLFVGDLMQQLYRHMIGDPDRKRMFTDPYLNALNKKSFVGSVNAIVGKLQKSIINDLKDTSFVSKGYVTDLYGAMGYCSNRIKGVPETTGYAPYLRLPSNKRKESFDEEWDVFCFIFDRDRRSGDRVNPKRYIRFLDNCRDASIEPYVSNPCFEFWILMHFIESIPSFDENKVLENKKVDCDGIERSYVECILHRCLEYGYRKDFSTVEPLLANDCKLIDTAMVVSKSYASDLTELESRIGTNVGNLIQRMRDNK